MDCREALANVRIEGESADRKDLAQRHHDICDEKQLDLPSVASVARIELRASRSRTATSYLRPTAARFLSDRHSRYPDTRIAMNARMIDPVPSQPPAPTALYSYSIPKFPR